VCKYSLFIFYKNKTSIYYFRSVLNVIIYRKQIQIKIRMYQPFLFFKNLIPVQISNFFFSFVLFSVWLFVMYLFVAASFFTIRFVSFVFFFFFFFFSASFSFSFLQFCCIGLFYHNNHCYKRLSNIDNIPVFKKRRKIMKTQKQSMYKWCAILNKTDKRFFFLFVWFRLSLFAALSL